MQKIVLFYALQILYSQQIHTFKIKCHLGNGTFQQHKPGDKVKASIELKGYDDAMTLSYAVALAHGGTMVVCWGLMYPG
jgi:hypothetical protein